MIYVHVIHMEHTYILFRQKGVLFKRKAQVFFKILVIEETLSVGNIFRISYLKEY